jgi:ribosome-associated protein
MQDDSDVGEGGAGSASPSDDTAGAREDATVPTPPPRDGRRLAVECARLADQLKGLEIVVLEVGPYIGITDYFVLVTGTNRRQIRAIGEEIVVKMKRHGIQRTNMDGMDSGVWVLTDFGGVVIHIFNEEAREYYDLDGLWADARRVDWKNEPGFEGAGDPPGV